ncbi:hypothetical protein PENTCL1PPCAC_9872, partial [Pristionchus entomophagus]
NLWLRGRPEAKANREILPNFFIRCFRIENLYIQDLKPETLGIIRKTLGNVPIKHLIFYDRKCSQNTRKTVVEMTRKHSVDKVTLCVREFELKSLRQFFLDVTETTKLLDIYER